MMVIASFDCTLAFFNFYQERDRYKIRVSDRLLELKFP